MSRECFIPFISHKLSKALDPAINLVPDGPRKKALDPAGNLLVAFSGGLGSTVMLDAVYKGYFAGRQLEDDARGDPGASGGIQHPRYGRVWKRAAVCYVETCAADLKVNAFAVLHVRDHDACAQATDETERIRSVVSAYPDFEFIPLRLEAAFDTQWWARVRGSPISEPALALNLQNDGQPRI